MMPRATCGTAPLMADSARVDDPVLHQAAGVPRSLLQLHQTLRSAVVAVDLRRGQGDAPSRGPSCRWKSSCSTLDGSTFASTLCAS